MTMQKLLLSLILASFTDPLLSLPLIDSREIPYQFPDGKMNFGELSSLDEDDLLHNLPAVLAKHNLIGDTDALLSKEDAVWQTPTDIIIESPAVKRQETVQKTWEFIRMLLEVLRLRADSVYTLLALIFYKSCLAWEAGHENAEMI
uniref:Urotensin 2 n=1 Tax=Xenopus tropicalis TaxID=8364 RepID=A0A6I8QML6_XENTR